jgi:hypothetical protein
MNAPGRRFAHAAPPTGPLGELPLTVTIMMLRVLVSAPAAPAVAHWQRTILAPGDPKPAQAQVPAPCAGTHAAGPLAPGSESASRGPGTPPALRISTPTTDRPAAVLLTRICALALAT